MGQHGPDYVLKPRSPGDVVCEVAFDEGREASGGVVATIYGEFYAMDWARIPSDAPHPQAGKWAKVTHRMKSCNPLGGDKLVTHLWLDAEPALGVAECTDQFVCYSLDSFPADWPKEAFQAAS